VRRGDLGRRTGHPRLARDPQMQSLTLLEDPMTADRVLPLGKTGKRLPGLINDLQLVVVEGGPHAIAWSHADQVTTAVLASCPADPPAAAPPPRQPPPKE
jgi:hypothetical protein